MKNDVFGGDAFGELAIDLDEHVLGALLEERLCSQHMLDLGSANTKGKSTKGTVGGSVRVTADDGGAGSVKPCSGPMMCTIP